MVLTSAHAVALAAGVALVAVGLVVARNGYRRLQPELRRLRDEPLSAREATATARPVELRGAVEAAGRVLEAPFTGEHCVAVEWSVEEYTGGKGESWRTLASGGQHVPFRIADETGSVRVEPDGAELTLTSGTTVEVGREETARGRIREFLRGLEVEPGDAGELSLGPLSMGTGDRRRYVEERLDVGEHVSVFGLPERDPDAGGDWGSDQHAATVRDASGEPFVIADRPAVPVLRRSTLVAGGILATGAVVGGYGLLTLVRTLVGLG